MDKITENLEDAARPHNNNILYWHVNELKGSSQSRLVPVKDRNGTTIIGKERVKKRWAEHFANVLNQEELHEKIQRKMKKFVIPWMGSQIFFLEEELATVLKGIKNNKAPGADSVVNNFFKYGGSMVGNKLLKIMNMILEKSDVPKILGKP